MQLEMLNSQASIWYYVSDTFVSSRIEVSLTNMHILTCH